MDEKDDGLGLSLGLGLTLGHDNSHHHQSSQSSSLSLRNLMQPLHENQNHNKSSLHDLFHSPGDKSTEVRSFLRGIDVNRAPSVADIEDETGVSSPNSTVSSLSGKRSEREENEAERDSCSRGSDDEDGNGAARKKLRLTKEQSLVLEETFKEHNALNPKQKLALAQRLNLRPRQVEVWFQNRRARTKLKQTEFDCEYLKRCCENLTEENRRLQKEVQELRALKLSPQLYMHMNPPTTLTMCPSCERVAVTSQSSASSSAAATSSMAPAAPSRQNLISSTPQQPRPINPWTSLSMNNRMV